LSSGWIDLNAPTDFTEFSVTAATGFVIYCHWTGTEGIRTGRLSSGNCGYVDSDPPYSGDVTFANTTKNLNILFEGSGS